MIPIRSIKQEPGDADDASGQVTQIPFRPRPPLRVFDNQSVATETAEDRGGVTGADPEQASGRVDGQGRVLGEERVDLAGEVSEPGAGEEVVALPEVASGVSERAVVTSGIVTVEPGSANVIPGLARVTVDFREAERDRVDALQATIVDVARGIALSYGVEAEFEFEVTIPPVRLDAGIQTTIAAAAAARELSYSSLPSGAGHDSQSSWRRRA